MNAASNRSDAPIIPDPSSQPDPLEGLTVAELLERWPSVIPVFLKHRMSCVGCPMARFESLPDAALIYGLDEASFLQELRALI